MPNIAIIGGGAAGFFAAITAKSQNPESNIIIFERDNKVLEKVEITGGGRCNLTNSFAHISDLKQAYPRGDKLIKRLFKSFDYQDTYQWFEQRGVKLVTQADECVFPQSQSSLSVIHCLVQEAKRLGIIIRTGHKVERLKPLASGDIEVHFKDQKPQVFHRVAITTGGSPRAAGLQYLADIGHEIVQPVPSLFTFNIADQRFKALMGTVVDPVFVSIPSTKWRSEGPLLITHWGMSGPVILKISSHAARFAHEHAYHFPLSINWIHETYAAKVEQAIGEISVLHAQKQLGSIRPYNLSSRLWMYLIERMNLSAEKRWNELGRKHVNKLIETLTNDTYEVSGKGAWKDEFVTCGGVSLSSINLNTLESKACSNLYFAGEVLDVDAITGGFNLQAAWTMGYVVGQHIGK